MKLCLLYCWFLYTGAYWCQFKAPVSVPFYQVLLFLPILCIVLSFYFINLLEHVSLGYFRCLMLWLRDWLEKEVVWIKIMPLAPSSAGGLHLKTVK